METNPDKQTGSRRYRLLCFMLGLLIATVIAQVVVLIVLGSSEPVASTSPESSEYEGKVCTEPSCVLRAGQLLDSIDNTVDPCDDFYQYACGHWLQTNTLPAGSPRLSRHGEVRELVMKRMRELWEQPYDKTTDSVTVGKAKTLYKTCMDEDAIAEQGAKPLKQLVDSLGTWPLTSPDDFKPPMDLESTLAKLALDGVIPLFYIKVRQDKADSTQFITKIDTPDFGIEESYLIQGRDSQKVTEYEKLLQQLAVHVLGLSSTPDLSEVVQFEVDLAKTAKSADDQMDSKDMHFKKLSISELQAAVPKFAWSKFLEQYFTPNGVPMSKVTEVELFGGDYLKSMFDLYEKTDNSVVANFLLMRIIFNFRTALSSDISELDADFKELLYGVTQSPPRWKTCVSTVQDNVPAAEGQEYVANYFKPADKQKAISLTGEIKQSMRQLLENANWMDDNTKAEALKKIGINIQKIGYPDYQFDDAYIDDIYKDLDVGNDSYFQNFLNAQQYSVKYNAGRLLRKPSRTKWHHSAAYASAFFYQGRNSFTMPAGILQPPFYSGDYPMAMMFGAVGVMIGHEFTHGFDSRGRKMDENGNVNSWWSDASEAEYLKRSKCFVDQYSQLQAVGEKVSGSQTLAENIADNGGVRASFGAFEAWQETHGRQDPLPGLEFSNEQVFFLAYAQTRCTLITDAGLRFKLVSNNHSPNQFRIRVPLKNFDKFAEAFQCPVGSPMNPAHKCRLW